MCTAPPDSAVFPLPSHSLAPADPRALHYSEFAGENAGNRGNRTKSQLAWPFNGRNLVVPGFRETGDKPAEADVGGEPPIPKGAVCLRVRPAARLSAMGDSRTQLVLMVLYLPKPKQSNILMGRTSIAH